MRYTSRSRTRKEGRKEDRRDGKERGGGGGGGNIRGKGRKSLRWRRLRENGIMGPGRKLKQNVVAFGSPLKKGAKTLSTHKHN